MLEADGYTVGIVEQRIPNTWITRDFLGFADLIAVSPSRGIVAVQATGGASTSNFHARVAKIKAEPRHAIWLAAGGRIQVHSHEGKGKNKEKDIWLALMQATDADLRMMKTYQELAQKKLYLTKKYGGQ